MAPQVAGRGPVRGAPSRAGRAECGSMRRQFKDTVTELAANDERVVVILGDISHYLFSGFQERFPSRFYNMGICENALISVAAGMSAQGFHPFVHTIAPFITERSLEQIKLD